jgi:hypothetical protein
MKDSTGLELASAIKHMASVPFNTVGDCWGGGGTKVTSKYENCPNMTIYFKDLGENCSRYLIKYFFYKFYIV